MASNEHERQYARLSPKTIKKVGRFLADIGEAFDADLSAMLDAKRLALAEVSEFAVWMAESLGWARYAARERQFFESAAMFIDSGNGDAFGTACSFPGRFGAERLEEALLAFHRWLEGMPVLRGITVEPLRWKALQERSLLIAERLKATGDFRGVGLWLFPAPFKIWQSRIPRSGKTAPSTASSCRRAHPFRRALNMLQRNRVINIEDVVLQGGDHTFADEYTNLWALQLPQRQLTEVGGTSVLHINAGLHELGWRGSDG